MATAQANGGLKKTTSSGTQRRTDQPLIILDTERVLIGDLTINLADRTLIGRNRREVSLTGNEFTVIATLIKSTGSFVPRSQILTALGAAPDGDSKVVDVYVNYLRRKLVSAASAVTIDKGPLGEFMLRP